MWLLVFLILQTFHSFARFRVHRLSFSLHCADNKTPGDIHIHYKATKPFLTFLISVCREDQTTIMCSRGKLTIARGMNRLFAINPFDTPLRVPPLPLLLFLSLSSLPFPLSSSSSLAQSKFHVQLESFYRT